MRDYICSRCHYKTNVYCNLKKHLARKQLCDSIHSTMSPEDILASIDYEATKDKKYVCECGKRFSTASSRSHHKSKCQGKQDEIAELKKEIRELKERMTQPINHIHVTNNNVINVIPVNNTTEPLRDFGSENRNAIPYSCIIGCVLDNLNYRGLLENLHFDPDYPENHNVRLKSIKRSMMEIYKNNRWNVTTLQNGLKELIDQGTRIFNEFLHNNKHRILEEELTQDELHDLLIQLGDVDAMSKKYIEPMKQDIQALLESYKGTSLVASTM